MQNLTETSKEEVAKKIAAVEKAGRELRAALLGEINGYGRYDQASVNAMERAFNEAYEEVGEFLAECQEPKGTGLLAGAGR